MMPIYLHDRIRSFYRCDPDVTRTVCCKLKGVQIEAKYIKTQLRASDRRVFSRFFFFFFKTIFRLLISSYRLVSPFSIWPDVHFSQPAVASMQPALRSNDGFRGLGDVGCAIICHDVYTRIVFFV